MIIRPTFIHYFDTNETHTKRERYRFSL